MQEQLLTQEQEQQDRIDSLVKRFNGAIKYMPMVKDHPEWTDDECLDFARKHHQTAIDGLRIAFERDRAGEGNWHNILPGWNNKIPYCRNLPTISMIDEANEVSKK